MFCCNVVSIRKTGELSSVVFRFSITYATATKDRKEFAVFSFQLATSKPSKTENDIITVVFPKLHLTGSLEGCLTELIKDHHYF